MNRTERNLFNQKATKATLSKKIPTKSSMDEGESRFCIVSGMLREYFKFNNQLWYTEFRSGKQISLDYLEMGSLKFPKKSVTGTYTISINDCIIFADGTFTITLPPVAIAVNKIFWIVNMGTGIITLDGDGSEEIGGSTTQPIGSGESITCAVDETDYGVL